MYWYLQETYTVLMFINKITNTILSNGYRKTYSDILWIARDDIIILT